MSPEQGHGEPIDARSDLYSLGVIVFEMLAREKPFKAENPMAIIYKHRKEPVPRLPAPFEALQPIIERFLAKAPQDRFANAARPRHALEKAYRVSEERPRTLADEPQTMESILLAPTPPAWVAAAVERWRELLVDHANCEKKAASTAVALIFAYPEDHAAGAGACRGWRARSCGTSSRCRR